MVIVTTFNTANAQSWYKVASMPDGASIKDLQADNAGNLYALKSTGYLYYSTNNGNSWTEVAGTAALGGVYDFAVNKATGEIYASTGYIGLQWTANHGASWAGIWFISSPTTGFVAGMDCIALKPGTNIIVCQCAGISFWSLNGGSTWRAGVDTISSYSQYTLKFLADGTLLCGTTDGVMRSTTFGNIWAFSNTGLYLKNVIKIDQKKATSKIFAAVNYNNNTMDTTGCGVYVSVDNGNTWAISSTGIIDRRVTSVTVDSASGNIYAASYNGIYQSADDGNTWALVNTSLTGINFTSLAINSTGIFSGNLQTGIASTSIPAAAWASRNNGIPIIDGSSTMTLCISDTGDIRLLDNNNNGTGVHHYTGGNWSAQDNGLPVSRGQQIVEDRNGILYTAVYTTYYLVTAELYKSTDNGNTWTNISTLPVPAGFHCAGIPVLKLDKNNNLYLLANYDVNVFTPGATKPQKVFRTPDGGATWTNIFTEDSTSDSPLFNYINDIDLAPDSSIYITIFNDTFSSFSFVTYGEIMRSTDWGATFSLLPNNIRATWASNYDLVAGPDDSLYVVNGFSIYKNDGIGHWNALPRAAFDTTDNFLSLYIDSINEFYVTNNLNGIFYSNDNATTWSSLSVGLPTYLSSLSSTVIAPVTSILFDTHNVPYAYVNATSSGLIPDTFTGIYKYGIPPVTSVKNTFGQSTDGNVIVYPNPTTGSCTIRLSVSGNEDVPVMLYNVTGQLVNDLGTAKLQPGLHYMTLDMSGLPSGIYMLETMIDGSKSIVKIIKQ